MENEAIKYLEFHKKGLHDTGYNAECVNFAIKALEEIQQYRAIQKMIGIPLEDFAKLCAEKVPEECKNPQKAIILTDEDVDKWEAYKKIGTIEEFKALKGKKPISKNGISICPMCGALLRTKT